MLLGLSAQAEILPGRNDPELRAALAEWLENDPTTEIEALRQIGHLAANGNIAAQHFANQTRAFHVHPGSAMPRDAWLALFARGEGDTSDGFRFRPYQIAPEVIAPLQPRFTDDIEVEDWAARIAILAEEDLQTRVHFDFAISVNHFGLQPVLSETIAPHVTPDNFGTVDYWMFLTMAQSAQAVGLSDPLFWPVSSEVLLDQTGFHTALAAQRFTALQAAAWAVELDHALTIQDDLQADVAAFRSAIVSVMMGETATPADIDRAGRLIAADAQRTPFLRPLNRACQTACAGAVPACLAAIAASPLQWDHRSYTLELVLQPAEYFASPRADQAFWMSVANTDDVWRQRLSQCLLEAAP